MSSLKTLQTKETYQEKIKTKKKGTQINIFKSIQNFENFCMEKHGKANIIPKMKDLESDELFDVLQSWINWNYNRAASTDGKAWTEKLWIYDFRTYQHFTLKEDTLSREHLDDFVKCYNVKNLQKRKEAEQFHAYSYDGLIKRDKISLDIFWLKDDSLEDIENLPPPDILAEEIKDNLESTLDSINELIVNLSKK